MNTLQSSLRGCLGLARRRSPSWRCCCSGRPIGAAPSRAPRLPKPPSRRSRCRCRSCRNISRRRRRTRTATPSSARCSIRRGGPHPTAMAEAAKPKIQRGQFALSGTLMVDGKATAFLREVNGGKSRRVTQGETVNGMVVAEIRPDRVRLTVGEESEDLALKVATDRRPRSSPSSRPRLPRAPPKQQPPRRPRRRSRTRWPSGGARRARPKPRPRGRGTGSAGPDRTGRPGGGARTCSPRRQRRR